MDGLWKRFSRRRKSVLIATECRAVEIPENKIDELDRSQRRTDGNAAVFVLPERQVSPGVNNGLMPRVRSDKVKSQREWHNIPCADIRIWLIVQIDVGIALKLLKVRRRKECQSMTLQDPIGERIHHLNQGPVGEPQVECSVFGELLIDIDIVNIVPQGQRHVLCPGKCHFCRTNNSTSLQGELLVIGQARFHKIRDNFVNLPLNI